MCQARSVAKAQGAGTVEMDLLEVVHGMLGLPPSDQLRITDGEATVRACDGRVESRVARR